MRFSVFSGVREVSSLIPSKVNVSSWLLQRPQHDRRLPLGLRWGGSGDMRLSSVTSSVTKTGDMASSRPAGVILLFTIIAVVSARTPANRILSNTKYFRLLKLTTLTKIYWRSSGGDTEIPMIRGLSEVRNNKMILHCPLQESLRCHVRGSLQT